MDSVEIPYGKECRPLAGRIVLDVELAPEKVDSLYVPEVSRTQTGDSGDLSACITAKVVAVGYGAFLEQNPDTKKNRRYFGVTPEDIKPGDRVLYRPLLMEVGQKRIVTDVRRVDGVLTPGDPA